MKNALKIAIVLALAIPLVFAGCQKTDVSEPGPGSLAENGDFKNNENFAYCGEPVTFQFAIGAPWAQPPSAVISDAGIVKVGNDANGNLKINVTANEGYSFVESRYWVGLFSDNPNIIKDGTPSNFEAHYLLTLQATDWLAFDKYLDPVTSFEYMTNVGDLQCFQVVVQTKLPDGTFLYAIGNTKNWGYYAEYCMQDCDEPTCETAFAYNPDGDATTYCFLTLSKTTGQLNPTGNPKDNFNRWGWSNNVDLTEGPYEFEIWGAAGQCDLSKGTQVGTLDISWDGAVLTVEYNAFEGFTFDETHLYFGDYYPNGASATVPMMKNGKLTVAPGQYPYKDGNATVLNDDYVKYEIEIDLDKTDIENLWIIAHSVACGDFDE